jgi:hypothetical protein
MVARLSLLPACPRRNVVCDALRPLPHRSAGLAQSPGSSVLPRAAVREARPLYPRGPGLRCGVCCPAPSSLTPTPSASLAGTRRLHSRAAYTPRLRCAGAPRRPTRPSLLSLLCCPRAPPTLHRWVPRALPLCARTGYQAASDYQRVATHKHPSLPAILDGVIDFGAASFASGYGSCACPALLTGYDEVKSRALRFAY